MAPSASRVSHLFSSLSSPKAYVILLSTCQLVAPNKTAGWDPGEGGGLPWMTYTCNSWTLPVTCLLSMWYQCVVCSVVLLRGADLLATVSWGEFDKLPSPLLFGRKMCVAVQGGVSELPDSSLASQNRVGTCYSLLWQVRVFGRVLSLLVFGLEF